MADTQDLRFRVLAQVLGTDAIKELDDQINKVTNSAQKGGNGFTALKTGIQALAGAFVVQQAVQFSKSLIDMGDELKDLAEKTGVTVEDLSGFKVAAETGGIGVEELTKSFAKLSKNLIEAGTGNRQIIGDFKAVGVAFKEVDGSIRPTGDVIKDLADKFSKMENGPAKAALAIKLFGKSGADMIPFLNQGREELEKFSGIISGDFARRADQFNDSLAVMKANIQSFGSQGLSELLPTLQEIVNTFNKTKSNGDGVTFFKVIGEGVRIGVIGFTTLYEVSKNLVDRIITLTRSGINELAYFFTQLGDNVSTRIKQIGALATGDLDKANKLGDELEARTKERQELRLQERERLNKGFSDREMERMKTISQTYQDLSKNSLLLGKGNVEDISKRQKQDTAPDENNRKKLAADLTEIARTRKVERDRVQEFINLSKLENEQRIQALGDINLTAQELRKVTETRKIDIEALKMSKTMNDEQKKALYEATAEIKKQREAIIDLEYQQKRTFVYGTKEYLRTYVDEVTNSATQVKNVFSTAFASMENTLVDFIKTGKLNFRKFADDVITELMRIAVRQAILAPIAGALTSALSSAGSSAASSGSSQIGSSTYSGAANSGNFTLKANGGIVGPNGDVPLKKYARGGVATSPQYAIFGEGSTPEAYVPLPDGRSIPVNMKGGGGSGGVQVNMTFNIDKSGADNSTVDSDKETGKALGNLIKNVALKTIMEQKRPGGLLA